MDQHVWTSTMDLRKLVPVAMQDKLLMDWQLSGASASALRTGFKMGPFHLDAGHSVFSSWDVLLISHGHADHVFSIASFFLTEGLGPHCRVYAPQVARVEKIIQSVLACNYNTDALLKLPATFCEAQPGLEDRIKIGNDTYMIRTRALRHKVPAVGYFVYKETKKLNPILKAIMDSMPGGGAAFGKFLSGIRSGTPYKVEGTDMLISSQDINQHLMMEQFCFLTDTNITGIKDNQHLIKEFPIIIVECTFYHKDDLSHAVNKKHMHWIHLYPLILQYPNSLWVLIHSSQRYKDAESIKDAIADSYKGAIPENCVIWSKVR